MRLPLRLRRRKQGSGATCALVFARGFAVGVIFLAALLFVTNSLIAHTYYGRVAAVLAPEGEEDALHQLSIAFHEVMDLASRFHIEPIDIEKNAGRIITGALQSFDRYGGYMDPEMTSGFLSGPGGGADKRVSLGIVATNLDDAYVIEAVFSDSPAEGSGLRAGQRIIAVNGSSLLGLSFQEAARAIQGAVAAHSGGAVRLRVQEPGTRVEKNLTVIPDAQRLPLAFNLGVRGGIAHIVVGAFRQGLADDVLKAIRDAEEEARSTSDILTGLVLDLRGNVGGLTDEAVELMELFAERGSVIYRMAGRAVGLTLAATSKEPLFPDLPVAILIDGGSASAAEIVASAAQVHGLGPVIGWPSYGKGTVQRIFPMMDGGSIKVTIAEYGAADGRLINEIGVIPDRIIAGPDPRRRPSRFAADPALSAAREDLVKFAAGKTN